MCGRYTLAVQLDMIQDRFLLKESIPAFTPRYNIAPTQMAPVITESASGRRLELMRWGLVPAWAKDQTIGNKLINARGETVAEKPSFRKSLQSRRCIVPSDGFYEWKKLPDGKSKIPIRLTVGQGDLFGFAGLWDSWKAPDGSELRTFTIITTEPNQAVASIHNRMPVILSKENEKRWLDPTITQPQLLLPLLVPYQGEMRTFEVSKAVNIPSNDSPSLIEPVA
jgi:putative SOS response-associated peptidase YedK